MEKKLRDGRSLNLNELEANQLLSGYGIPMATTRCATTVLEAEEIASEIGYPVVLKILSPQILHKTEAGCVKIGISNSEELVQAYEEILENAYKYDEKSLVQGMIVQEMMPRGLELIFGVNKDPQFGHTILFGSGGIYVEIFQDISLRLIPIDRCDALEMIHETKMNKILSGARGKNYNKEAVVDILLKLSKLIQENNHIEEIDINPFILYEEGLSKGVDALITLSD